MTGIIALAISFITLYDNKRKTKIMEEQLDLAKSEILRRAKREEASKDTRQLSSEIRSACDEGLSEDLWFLQERILTHLHDSNAESLKLVIEPTRLELPLGKHVKDITAHNVSDLKQIILQRPQEIVCSANFHFRCSPQIFDCAEESIILHGWLVIAEQIWRGCEKLTAYKDIIEPLDPNILRDLNQSANRIIEVGCDSLMSRQEIEFKKTDKSDQIYAILEQAFGSSIEREKKKLQDDVCARLDVISKELIPKQ